MSNGSKKFRKVEAQQSIAGRKFYLIFGAAGVFFSALSFR